MVSQFGQEEAERTCLLIKDLKIPFGGTLADLIKNTSRECITKILVEEKVWTSHYFFHCTAPFCFEFRLLVRHCISLVLRLFIFSIFSFPSDSITRHGIMDAQCSWAKVKRRPIDRKNTPLRRLLFLEAFVLRFAVSNNLKYLFLLSVLSPFSHEILVRPYST